MEDTNGTSISAQTAGRIARDLSRSFDQYWNNPLAYPVPTLMTPMPTMTPPALNS